MAWRRNYYTLKKTQKAHNKKLVKNELEKVRLKQLIPMGFKSF